MTTKIKRGGLDPILQYEDERHSTDPLRHVERRIFNQVYDYALWLQYRVSGNAKQETEDMFTPGNVLKCIGHTEQSPLFVLVNNVPFGESVSFSATILLDVSEYYDVGSIEFPMKYFDSTSGFTGLRWSTSSFEEVANAR